MQVHSPGCVHARFVSKTRHWSPQQSRRAMQPRALPYLDSQHADKYRDLACRLADAAGDVIRPYFRRPLAIDSKADASPVTEADRNAEMAMREIIMEACPSHEVLGEEHGLHAGAPTNDPKEQGYRWVLDPIDGTKAFVTGKPTFGTLIALLHKGVPVLGVIDQCISRERWIGVQGQPTTLNGEVVKTRSCEKLSDAYLYATSPHIFVGPTQQAGFARVRDKVKVPSYGCDCYAYGLLACGFVDVVVEATMQPYDYMALIPVVEGAGGKISDWQGASLHWTMTPSGAYSADKLPNELTACGDPQLHREVVALLQSSC